MEHKEHTRHQCTQTEGDDLQAQLVAYLRFGEKEPDRFSTTWHNKATV